jgi:HEAT repeats
MKTHLLKICCRLACFFSLLLLASCTITHSSPKMVYTGYKPEEKIHLKVALNLTDELRNAKWDEYVWGVTDIWPVGRPLAENVPLLAWQTFMDVVEINNGSPPPNPVDAVLTPKVAFIGFKQRGTTFSSDTIDIKLEWTLVDLNGGVIWADTFTGESHTASNWWRTFRLAMEQALRKSRQAMLSSQTIQQFVLKKYPDVHMTITTNCIVDPDILDLCMSLNSTNRGELKDALKKLRQMNASEAVPDILPCLKNPDPGVVREACRTLAVLGNKDTVPDIEPLLNNPREDIRKDAQQAIDKLNPDIMGLRSSLNSTNQGELKDVLRKLREMHAPEVVPNIVPCLKHPDPGVVREACRTLAVLGNKDTIPDIEPLLNSPREDIRKDAQKAIDILRSKSQ